MSFHPDEIGTMLVDYENDHKTGMNIGEISEEIYKYTNGYPFLVSKLCKTIDEELDKDWSTEGVEKAVKSLLVEKNTLKVKSTRRNGSNMMEKIFTRWWSRGAMPH